MTWLYAACRLMLVGAGRLLFGVRVSGAEKLPAAGGCIIASNHASYLDPMLLAVASPRMLCFMAKEELFAGGFGVLIRHLNAFPVRRGSADVRAMRQAIAHLQAGQVLIIFPEGTRSRDGVMGSGHAGIGMLAERAGVPVIPAFIEGSGGAWPQGARLPRFFVPIRIAFGAAVDLPAAAEQAHDRAHYQAVTDTIVAAIKNVKNSLS